MFAAMFFGVSGSLLMIFSKVCQSYEMLISGRFLIGINTGLDGCLCPLYLIEISPVAHRGSVGSIYQLVVAISVCVSYVTGFTYTINERYFFYTLSGIALIPVLCQVGNVSFYYTLYSV